MKRKAYCDGREDGLSPLKSLDLNSVKSFSDLVRGMAQTAFGGRQLGESLDVFLEMTRDPECKVVMTISGAMTVAKQGRIMCEMIDRGLVDVIIATGALIAHGLIECIGLVHYAVNPQCDDAELYLKGYNRIYDTLEMEANLNDAGELIAGVLENHKPEGGVWCSESFCRAIGKRLEELDKGPGILRSAFKKGVPVFIPAFTDCELGLDFSSWAMVKAFRKTINTSDGQGTDVDRLFQAIPPFNPFLDLNKYARIVGHAKKLGIFTIGGGVPRNWAQQVAPYYDYIAYKLNIELEAPRFKYGIRICPEPDHWGGLSGCTYSEGVSWGKFVPREQGGRFAEVYADATLVWPLLMKAVFEEMERG
jgi:deoxyhypusine synthase